MTITPSIDIIIPNYNKAKYLNECLDSVLKQTYKNWKIYLVDDFSNDNSKEILNKFKNDPRISITYLESNHGPAFCRNLGIEKSSSELIAFLDSDDFWPIDKLQIQITNMLKNDNDFTYTDFKFFFTAKPEVRAQRRWEEMEANGYSLNYNEVFQLVPEFSQEKINFIGFNSNLITLICFS